MVISKTAIFLFRMPTYHDLNRSYDNHAVWCVEMMIEDHLEQLALTWFQDAGWKYCYAPDIAQDVDTQEL